MSPGNILLTCILHVSKSDHGLPLTHVAAADV